MKLLLLRFISLSFFLPTNIICMENDLFEKQIIIHNLEQSLEHAMQLLEKNNKKLQKAKLKIKELEYKNIKLKNHK